MLERAKAAYLLWYGFYQTLPKLHRYSLGQRIDELFVELIEAISAASFLSPDEKMPYVRLAIRKTDTLKLLMMVLWEAKSLDNQKYAALSEPIEEVGRMLGGWIGQLQKRNSPEKSGEKRG
ncbi:MAG: four helix bundle protein [Patescibacteria group bacterium]|nr:four helix bundle protein [Patescibacteria group bacterium]